MSKKGQAPSKGAPSKSGNQNADLAAKHGVSEAEVAELKAAFDLFDTDQGGSIDTKGNFPLIQNLRQPWSHWASTPRTPSSSR